MTTETVSRTEEWPSEHRESGNMPQQGTSPAALHLRFSDARRSGGARSPSPARAVDSGDEIYEVHSGPKETMARVRMSRTGDLDHMLGSMTSLHLESGKENVPIFANGGHYDASYQIRAYSPRPRDGRSPTHPNLTATQSARKNLDVESTTISRRPSNLDVLVRTHSSSSFESPPPPRRPPGPGPGPSPIPGPSVQIVAPDEHDEDPSPSNSQSPTSPIRDLDQPSPTRKLFAVRSGQNLHPRSRSRQPQRKESGDDILEKIKILRAEVWGLRSNVSEKRNVLREKELAKSVADDKFMQFIRTHGMAKLSRRDKMKEQDTLTKLLEECEMLRNEYGPLEDDCNLLQNILNNREYEMQKMEAALDERWNEEPHSQYEPVSPIDSPPQSNYSGSEFSQDFHPLVAEYLSKLGDVEIFRERLEWHSEEKLTLEAEKDRRGRVELKLPEPDQKWLDSYSAAEQTLQKQLEEAEEVSDRLRMQCYALGLIDEEGDPLDFERQERQTFIADEIDAGAEISDFVRFPLLLPYPGNKDEALPDPSPPPDDTEGEDMHERIDPSDRINGWLLEKLRNSPLDVNLLVRTFEQIVGHTIEGERWQFDVLSFWYNDGSKEMAMDSKSLSEVATQSRHKTGEQPTSLSARSGIPAVGFFVRSSKVGAPKKSDAAVQRDEYDLFLPSSGVGRKDR